MFVGGGAEVNNVINWFSNGDMIYTFLIAAIAIFAIAAVFIKPLSNLVSLLSCAKNNSYENDLCLGAIDVGDPQFSTKVMKMNGRYVTFFISTKD